jgi:hypothetical protein
VASPYFVESELYARLLAAMPMPFTPDAADENRIWTGVFGAKPFERQRYNRLLSDATAYLLAFLTVEKLRENAAHGDLALAEAFAQRDLTTLYEKNIDLAQANLQQQPLRDTDFYAAEWQQGRSVLAHRQREPHRTDRTNLDAVHRSLDCFFIVEKLRRCCEVLNHQSILQHTYTVHGTTATLAFAQYYLDIPAVSVYLAVYELLTQRTETAFFALQELLAQHRHYFVGGEQRELYTYCLNYCIRAINSGDEAYLLHYLQLFWLLLAEKIVFLNEKLPIADYKNTIAIGLRAGEYARIAAFIQDYSQYLPTEFRANAVQYNMAKLYFAQADYQKVISTLQTVQYENVFYVLDSRWTLLKAYYELDEMTALEGQITAFRLYLLREKTIGTFTKKQYKQLLQYLKKIVFLQAKTAADRAAFADYLSTQNIVADKKWLLSKCV